MAEEAKGNQDKHWQGSPLQMWKGMDPNGITEIVIEFDTGDEEILKPRMRDEFHSYEFWQAATYIESLSHRLG